MAKRSPAEQQREREAQDLRYMSNPSQWVLWPFCPIKRYVKDAATNYTRVETAYLIAQEGKLTTVFHGVVFTPDIEKDRQQPYAGFQEIVADGWMVD